MNKKIGITLTSLLMLLASCGGTSSAGSSNQNTSSSSSEQESSSVVEVNFENPVFEPVFADPSVIRAEDGTFYAFGTQDTSQWGDSFGVKYGPIISSKDLVNWKFEKAVFNAVTFPTWNTTSGAGIWAPDITYINGQYVLYYSLSAWGDPNPGIGVATAPSPLGPWEDHGKLLDSESSGVPNSIDPTVFVADDGRVYMVWGSFIGLYGIELSADGLSIKNPDTLKEDKVFIAGLQNNVWTGSTYEGAYIRKIGDYYYMFVSSGTCCDGFNSSYHVRVARSESPLGPYVDAKGDSMAPSENRGEIVVNRSDRFVGVGHNSIIQDDAGDYWMLYHGFDKEEDPMYGTTNRRSLLIDKLVWTEDGWPYVEGYEASTTSVKPVINQK